MKTKISILAMLVAATLSVLATSTNKNLWIAISPNLTGNELHSFCGTEFNWLLTAPAGTHIRFIDGLSLNMIADLKVPDIQNPKGRSMKLGSEVQKIVNWVKSISGENSNSSGNIDLPGVLKSIAPYATPDTSILVVGSPIYLSAERGFNFFDPNEINPDARFRRPADCEFYASEEATPFGTKGLSDELCSGDVEVFWYIPEPHKMGSQLFQLQIQRTWALYVQKVGGALVVWDWDLDRTLTRVLDSGLLPIPAVVHKNETNFGMISMARDSGTNTLIVQSSPIIDMRDTEMPITDFILIDRTPTMFPRTELVRKKILQLSQTPRRKYAAIYFDDHDITPPHGVELFSVGQTLSQIADQVKMFKVWPGHPTTTRDTLEDAVALVETMAREQNLHHINIFILTDAPPYNDCPFGYDYETEAKQLMAEGASIFLADLHIHVFNQLPGTHIF